MGLLISVYRNSEFGDSTNGGLSSVHNSFCVTNVDGPFNPSEKTPELILEKGPFNTVRLVVPSLKGQSAMFGGNFGNTSDSRFGQAVNKIIGINLDIVKIFDRVEKSSLND